MAFLKYMRQVGDIAIDFVVPCIQCGKEYTPAKNDPYGLCCDMLALNNFCCRRCQMDSCAEALSGKIE